ncbi:hypothetical protein C0V75_19580 [Tabrizicola sp. TH137]|uniref:hypothetical protein n=1 Tax=Tabrizicola sp. TH137 TaxID=2067452 RepID=UPI000C7CBBE2|nr:hypothetical protein [Tabrizicola sp. TH137]PLL10879.1 hypothetical protein C0V75_19580 [Tabrizicola sp. TH137]
MDGGVFGAARGRIAADAAECVAAFEAAAGDLGRLQAEVGEIGARLAALCDFLGRQEGEADPVAGLRAEARALGSAMRGWVGRKAGAAVGPRLAEGMRAVDLIAREAQMLLAVASLTRVVASEAEDGGFEDYVRGLRDLAAAVSDKSLATRAGLGLAEAEVLRCVGVMADAVAVIDGLAARLGRAAEEVAALTAQVGQDRAALMQAAAGFPAAAGRETRGLIGCIQFSDILSQRLDHAGRILAMKGAGAAALAGAQMQAAVADGRAVLATALAGLEGLIRVGRAVLAVFDGHGGPDAARILLDRRQGELAQVEVASGAARGAAQLAATVSEAMQARLTEGLAATLALDRATHAINLSALNAAFLAARGSQSRGAMKVLSDAVRESAALCSESSAGCRRALEACVTVFDTGGSEAIRARADALQLALDGTRDGLVTARQAAQELAALQAAAAEALNRFVTAAGSGRAALIRMEAVVESLATTAAELASGSHGEISAELEAAARAIYTMEQEREVHRACLSGAVPAGVSGAIPARVEARARHADEAALAAILF